MNNILEKYSPIGWLAISFLILITFFSTLLISSLPYNPVIHNLPNLKSIFYTLPQGWAFFTKDPKETQVVLYEIDSFQRVKSVDHKFAKLKYFMGANRKVSKILGELQSIKGKLNESDFHSTKCNYLTKYIDTSGLRNSVTIFNEFNDPTICGEYLLTLQSVTPWAWSTNNATIKNPCIIVKLFIDCNE